MSFGELLQPDMSAVVNMQDIDGFYDEPVTRFLPAPLVQETQPMLEWHDWCDLHLGTLDDAVPPVGLTTFAVIAPGKKKRFLLGGQKGRSTITNSTFRPATCLKLF